MSESRALERRAEELAANVAELLEEIGRVIHGQRTLVEDLVVGVLAGGHVLLEGLPGLGKTRLVHALGTGLGLDFGRIQFTPDLMPADVTGTRIVEEAATGLQFRFQRGPLFAHLVLADEINRATPKTQSALLEAMQEGRVTVGETTHPLPRPFHVVATQNPIELEGTFPLPEAQLDRFLFHLTVPTPGAEDLVTILESTTGSENLEPRPVLDAARVLELQALVRRVLCGPHLLRYVAELLHVTDPRNADADESTRRLVRYGASPRAGQAIVLAGKARALLDGRPSVAREDLDCSMLPAVRHRIVRTFEAEAEGLAMEELLSSWQDAAWRRARRG